MGLDEEAKQNRLLGELLKEAQREVKERLEDLMLQDSLQVTQYLKLSMEERREQVGRSKTAKVFQLPEETKAIEVFTREDVAGRLLILGEPGSGKSTTLLQLAEDLIEQAKAAAERDSNFKVPVIFELSAWQNNKQSLEQWLIAQLKDNYSIDQRVSQKWLENEQILPLLDGLDELGIPRQRLAIQAINRYLQQKVSRQLVVCCRWEEYRHGNKKLDQLHGAYYLQPPKNSEIRDYLERLEQHQLWEKIDSNPLMKELAQKPLFLNLMIPAFQEEAILSEAKLFENFIANKLNPDNHDPRKYTLGIPYTEEETKRWLCYLARHLEADSLTVFLIEKMQVSWLSLGRERLAFKLVYGLFIGLILGLIMRLLIGLIKSPFSESIGAVEFMERPIVISFFGVIVGLIEVVFRWDLKKKINTVAFISWYEIINNKDRIRRLLKCLIFGMIFGLATGVIAGLAWGLLNRSSTYDELFKWLITGLITGVIGGSIVGLILGLILGITTKIKTSEIPNQGIKEAWKNSLIILVITFPFFALILPLTSLATGVTFPWQKSISFGLGVATLTSVDTGGLEWTQHLVVRLILWWQKKIPWNYAQFLDYAAERKLLQKTGGRYRFLHDSLRKYFVAMLPYHPTLSK